MYPFSNVTEKAGWSKLRKDECDDSSNGDTVPFLDVNTSERTDFASRGRIRTLLPSFLHAILISTYVALGLRLLGQKSSECFDDQLLKPPIVWEQRHFSSSVDTDLGIVNDTFGFPHAQMEEEWHKSLDVGVIRITESEMSRMPTETAHLYGDESGYAGILEVFHQLHCLNRLRSRFQNNHTITQHELKHPHMEHSHDMHCFSYLWQTIKCHADVSVMSLEYNDEQEAFNARFDVVKQCRNFDVIHDWAKAREAEEKPPGHG